MRSKTIRVPTYFESIKVIVVDVLDRPEYETYTVFEKKRMVLYIKPSAKAGLIAHEAVHIVNLFSGNGRKSLAFRRRL